MNVLNPPKFVTRSLIGAVGLSAIAFLGSFLATAATLDPGRIFRWCSSGYLDRYR